MANYKVGSNDPFVAKIQRALNEIMGSKLVTDGDYGGLTAAQMRAYQIKQGLPASGEYDQLTSVKLGPYIDGRFLKEADILEAATLLKVDPASVKAVTAVESKGSGYLTDGRLAILYERHIFRRELMKKLSADTALQQKFIDFLKIKMLPGMQRVDAIDKALIKDYGDVYHTETGGYLGGVREYDRLKKAQTLDEETAYRSASWGLFQIMGFNCTTAGYKTASELVKDYNTGEKAQLLSFCKFNLADNNLINALRARNWASYARWYNGPAYRTNKYDEKLQAAYDAAKK